MSIPDPNLPDIQEAVRSVIQNLDGTVIHDRTESVERNTHGADGSINTQRMTCAVQLADGTVVHPGQRVELGVCEMCADAPPKLFQRAAPAKGGLILLANGAFCRECGRFVCPKHRVTVGKRTLCRDCKPSELGPFIHGLLFRRVR